MTDRLTCEEIRDLAPGFVLGALGPEEVEAVREHLAGCPEAHAEYAELGAVASGLALAVEPREPSAGLKDRILAAAAADLEQRGGAAHSAEAVTTDVAAGEGRPATVTGADTPVRGETPAAPVTAGGVAPEVPIAFPSAAQRAERGDRATGPGPLAWAMRIAAVLAIVGLVGWNVLLQGRLDATETHARDVAAVLEAAAEPGALTAVLAPAEAGAGRGLAAIGPGGAVTLAIRDLAPTAGEQVYEAWVIVGDGAPIPLGGFAVGDGGTGRLDGSGPAVPEGAIVALTLEPGPGSTAPTEPILAVGVAGSPPPS